eukprot:g62117.t1
MRKVLKENSAPPCYGYRKLWGLYNSFSISLISATTREDSDLVYILPRRGSSKVFAPQREQKSVLHIWIPVRPTNRTAGSLQLKISRLKLWKLAWVSDW